MTQTRPQILVAPGEGGSALPGYMAARLRHESATYAPPTAPAIKVALPQAERTAGTATETAGK
jgi:hypothetical protein